LDHACFCYSLSTLNPNLPLTLTPNSRGSLVSRPSLGRCHFILPGRKVWASDYSRGARSAIPKILHRMSRCIQNLHACSRTHTTIQSQYRNVMFHSVAVVRHNLCCLQNVVLLYVVPLLMYVKASNFRKLVMGGFFINIYVSRLTD
jgi:hypothetical protein